MTTSKDGSFTDRIDPEAVRELEGQQLPAPIDALNLVDLADEASYRWYGLLLAPVLIPAGAWPVWVGVHHRAIHGEPGADEIVIVRYPHLRLLLRAVTSRYYAWVNRWRERGVRYFEFSITERVFGEPRLKSDRYNLFVRYNDREDGSAAALEEIRRVLEAGPARLVYASREVGSLAIFRRSEPSDPNPAATTRTAMFAIDDLDELARFLDDEVIGTVSEITKDLSMQVYRRQSTREAMPWARRSR